MEEEWHGGRKEAGRWRGWGLTGEDGKKEGVGGVDFFAYFC